MACSSCTDHSEKTQPAGHKNLIRQALSAPGAPGFDVIKPEMELRFPLDHGPHYRYRSEWWYLTGNLVSTNDPARQFGYQLTFFRLGNQPRPPSKIPLASEQIMMAHFAITDVHAQQFHHAERFARLDQILAQIQAPTAAEENGHEALSISLDDWQISGIGPELRALTLSARDGDVSLKLLLTNLHGIVLQGQNGYSLKSIGGQQASAYYSMPRWQSEGEISIGDQRYSVQGESWLDREWSTSQLAPDQIGWRWFALHLDDGRDVMLYVLIKSDGDVDAASTGKIRMPDGSTTTIKSDALKATPKRFWRTPAGHRYAVSWQLQVANLGALQVDAKFDGQFFDGAFQYWEGAVRISGDAQGQGYLEQVGPEPEA